MGKLTGLEPMENIPSKVLAVYQAVQRLLGMGRDVNDISVSAIADEAGIGKGTMYDYFDSKEELIACSFLFYVTEIAKKLSDKLTPFSSVREQLDYLFDEMERDCNRKACFVTFMHGATDNSKYSQMIREKLKESRQGDNFVELLLGDMVRLGVERGEINPDYPKEYLVYNVFCKIFVYMMCIGTEDCIRIDRPLMRKLIVDGIVREINAPIGSR